MMGKRPRASNRNRASRNRVRQALIREGLVDYGDGIEIHHLDGDPRNNERSNLWLADRCAHLLAHGQPCMRTDGWTPWERVCLNPEHVPVFPGVLGTMGIEARRDDSDRACFWYRLPKHPGN